MKHHFVVKAMAEPFQKFVFGSIAFLIAYGLLWVAFDAAEFNPFTITLVALALCLTVCGLLCFFGHYGVEVHLQNRLCREYIGLPGLKYGKWKSLPEKMEYILVFEPVRPNWFEMEMGVYEVSIVYEGKFRIIFLQSQSRRAAEAVAHKLSGMFGLEIINKSQDI